MWIDEKTGPFYQELKSLLNKYNARLQSGIDVETYEEGTNCDCYIDVYINDELVDSVKNIRTDK
jgi:hypothetical protein